MPAPRFSAWEMISLACRARAAILLRALCSKLEVLLAAFRRARPSAICFWRSCIALRSGGQTNFIVIQMKARNQSAWLSM